MDKNELISLYNRSQQNIYQYIKENIQNIIKNNLEQDSMIFEVSVLKDIEQMPKGKGFYMIFSNEKISNNNCQCQISISNEDYYCVYRGHCEKMQERIKSHLFFKSQKLYPNTMKIKIQQRFYQIDIGEKELYPQGATFPKNKWAVAYVELPKTKQAFRLFFEKAFDEFYKKPIYSIR